LSGVSIARPPIAVKGHRSPVEGSRPQEPRWAALPDVLGKMPPSCRAVFYAITALVGEGSTARTSVSELSRITRFSRRQVSRALARLEGAHLICWRGAGRGRGANAVVKLLWTTFPHKKWASKSQADYPVRERTSEAPYYSEKNSTKEGHALTSPLNWNQAFSKNTKATHQTMADRPLWPDGPAWCTRRVWSSLAGQVRRRSVELWGGLGTTATDAIMATVARIVRGGLVESEDELRELIRCLGGRLRESGHAIEILADRSRAFAFARGVARRWLRRRGKLEEPALGTVAATDWDAWQKAAFEVLDELSWAWERRSKPLGDVSRIVAKVQRAWLETPPARLHRRGWELVEAVALRGLELEEARWVVLAGLAAALGVRMPKPPRREPYDGTPEQQACYLLNSIGFCGGGDFS